MTIDAPCELRPATRLVGVQAYVTPRPDDGAQIDLWLDANEGPRRLLTSLSMVGDDERVRRYPSAGELERAIAERYAVDPRRVLVTAGVDDALSRACLAMLEVGDNILLTEPTFEMIARYAKLAGGDVRRTPWWEGAFPTESLLAQADERTRLIGFVSPNNPTGAAGDKNDLKQLSAACPRSLILADFAYAEFADEDLTAAAIALPNVLALRTFSKAWGLAGLRVGYAIGAEEVVDWLRAAGNPYAVASPSLALAMRSLREDEPCVQAGVARVRAEREALTALLARLGARPYPSQANFVFAAFDDADRVWRGLRRYGIAVRAFPGRAGLERCLRITCPGDAVAFERLSQAITSVMGSLDSEVRA